MPEGTWGEKREHQYEDVKASELRAGRSEKLAEEIAARTVNKERARHGESKTASRVSLDDISSERRGGLRSHEGPGGRTMKQLYEEARRKKIPGRSRMNKHELERVLDKK